MAERSLLWFIVMPWIMTFLSLIIFDEDEKG
jgi:hypothetical protein